MRFIKKAARGIPDIYLTLVLIVLYLPIGVVVAYSFNKSKNGVLWTGFTTEWYNKLFQSREIMETFRNSLIVALWSCSIAAVLGSVGAVALARGRFRSKGFIENVSTLPIMLPEIVLGMAYMTSFSLMGIPFGTVTLVLAHLAFCVPYVTINVRSRLVGLDPSYEEAARDLGASSARAFITIVVPLIAPAILAGVLLAFAMSLDDMVISLYASGPEAKTFPVYVYGKLKTNVPPSINAMSTLTLGVTCIAVALSRVLSGKRR